MGLYKQIERLYDKKIDASGLAIFRIAYSLVLLCEVIQLFYFRHLIFDKIPFIEPGEIDLTYALIGWIISIIFLTFGLFSQPVTIINYLFSLVFIATNHGYEYHMFYIYMGINFLLMFIDVSKVNSLDRLRLKLKYSNTHVLYTPGKTVSVLAYYVPVLIGIGFVYFDSVFHKVTSDFWLAGLGMWLPASLPQVVYLDQSWLLNVKPLVLVLGYVTLLLEFVFVFLFWFKRFRLSIFFIGIVLHIGILLVFPIPWFALGVAAIYLLLVPVCFWRWLKDKVSLKNPLVTFYYDEECPLCIRTKIVLSHLDLLKAIEFKGVQTYAAEDQRLDGISRDNLLDNVYSVSKGGIVREGIDTYIHLFKKIPALFLLGILLTIPGFYQLAKRAYRLIAKSRIVERCSEDNCGYTPPTFPVNSDDIKLTIWITFKKIKISFICFGISMLILLQGCSTYQSRAIRALSKKAGFSNTRAGLFLNDVTSGIGRYSKVLLGITGHSVFLSSHFIGYDHVIAIEYVKPDKTRCWLPIVDRNGNAGSYLLGPTWAKWSFRVNGPEIDKAKLQDGIKDFTAFWLYKNGLNTKDAQFSVWVMKIDFPNGWENNFLRDQMTHPWVNAGSFNWTDNNIYFELSDIEAL